jgi:hypothetical protein
LKNRTKNQQPARFVKRRTVGTEEKHLKTSRESRRPTARESLKPRQRRRDNRERERRLGRRASGRKERGVQIQEPRPSCGTPRVKRRLKQRTCGRRNRDEAPHRRRQDTASRCTGKTSEERQREGRKTLLRKKTLENRRRGSPGGANLCTAHAVKAASSSRERDTHGAPSVERCRNSEPRRHANQGKTSAERCRRKTEAGVPR